MRKLKLFSIILLLNFSFFACKPGIGLSKYLKQYIEEGFMSSVDANIKFSPFAKSVTTGKIYVPAEQEIQAVVTFSFSEDIQLDVQLVKIEDEAFFTETGKPKILKIENNKTTISFTCAKNSDALKKNSTGKSTTLVFKLIKKNFPDDPLLSAVEINCNTPPKSTNLLIEKKLAFNEKAKLKIKTNTDLTKDVNRLYIENVNTAQKVNFLTCNNGCQSEKIYVDNLIAGQANRLRFYTLDAAGLKSKNYTEATITPEKVNLVLTPDVNPNEWRNNDINIEVSLDKPVFEINKDFIFVIEGQNTPQQIIEDNDKFVFTITENGTYVVSSQIIHNDDDKFVLEVKKELPITKIDKTPPNISLAFGSYDEDNLRLTIKNNSDDGDGSGIKSIKYKHRFEKIDLSVDSTTIEGNPSEFIINNILPLSPNWSQNLNVFVQITDNVGNQTESIIIPPRNPHLVVPAEKLITKYTGSSMQIESANYSNVTNKLTLKIKHNRNDINNLNNKAFAVCIFSDPDKTFSLGINVTLDHKTFENDKISCFLDSTREYIIVNVPIEAPLLPVGSSPLDTITKYQYARFFLKTTPYANNIVITQTLMELSQDSKKVNIR